MFLFFIHWNTLRWSNLGHYSSLVRLVSDIKCVQLISMQVDSECSFHISWGCEWLITLSEEILFGLHGTLCILRISVLQRNMLSEVECDGNRCLLTLASVSDTC